MTERITFIPIRRMSFRTRAALLAKAPPRPAKPQKQESLFDHHPVSPSDLALWVSTMCPHIDPHSRRGANYIRTYDVAGKVAQAKAAGHWPPSRAFIA